MRKAEFIIILYLSVLVLYGCSKNRDTSNMDYITKHQNSNEGTMNQSDTAVNVDLTVRLFSINSIDRETKTLEADEIELIYSADTDRVKELGFEEEMNGEYYIYNKDVTLETISYDEVTSIYLLDEVENFPADIAQLEVLIKKHSVICNVTQENAVAVKISEVYMP